MPMMRSSAERGGGGKIHACHPVGARYCSHDGLVGRAGVPRRGPQGMAIPGAESLRLAGRQHPLRDQHRTEPGVVGGCRLGARSALRIDCHISTMLAYSRVTYGGRSRLIRGHVLRVEP